MRRLRIGAIAALSLAASLAQAAPDKAATTPSMAAEKSQIKPAEEKSIGGDGKKEKPKGSDTNQASSADSTTAGRPAMRGPRMPEALRKQLKAQLDARIERDVVGIKKLRVEAIELLDTFIKESPREAREMPEAMMRLGELKWENEREAFVVRFADWEKKPVDQRGPAPEPDYKPSRDLFGRVLKDYPWFPQYDLSLYIDGFLATEQGKPDEALTRFDRILKEFPNSRFVPDAHMARAEAMFNGKYDYAGALVEYEEVMKYPKSDLYGLALFKSAWCKWRLGDTDAAVKRFIQVFEVTDKAQGTTVAQRKQLDELQSEALKYLVEVFTEDEKNTAGDMYAFLSKIGGERFAGKIVRQLAVTFYDQSHYERGIEAYELLLKLEPTSTDAPSWMLQIAGGYNYIEDYPNLRKTYDRTLTGYIAGSPWAQAQGANTGVVDEATKKVEKQLREHALNLHGKAQKDKTSRAEFEGAAGLYEAYLTKYDKEPKAYRIHYYLGEIYGRRLEKPNEAATHYMAAARDMPEVDKDVQGDPLKRRDAVFNAIATLQAVRFAEFEKNKGKPEAGKETETDKKVTEALELYVQLYPNDPDLPETLFKQGKLYYDYGVFDPAVRIWASLLEKFPNSTFARGAGELILDSFNKSQNYDSIETWARRLKPAPSFQDAKTQAKLDGFIIIAVFKQGEQKSSAGDHAGAASAYLRAAKEFPKDPKAAQACVNAEIEARKAADVKTLKEAATLITGKDYRDKPESPTGAWQAATTLQAMGLFADSAEYHEAIADLADRSHPNYQKFEHAKDASYDAVVLRVAVGDTDRAIANGNKYLKTYGSTPEADEVTFMMGRAQQNAGRDKDAIALYRQYLAKVPKNQDHRVQGYVLLAKALVKDNQNKEADGALKQAVTLGKQLNRTLGPDGKFAAAEARYMEGERVLARFEEIKIEGDVKQLGKRLKQKAELLKEAAVIFLDTVKMGVAEWSTAALYQIGHMYEAFAKSMRDSPAPSNLSDADKELYNQQIEEFVVPIEEKSLDAYENGWKKAMELQIYNQWTAKMRDALGRLNAELYAPFKEIGFEVRSEGPSALPPLIDAPKREIAKTAPAPKGKK
jgi:TolA-binding protein